MGAILETFSVHVEKAEALLSCRGEGSGESKFWTFFEYDLKPLPRLPPSTDFGDSELILGSLSELILLLFTSFAAIIPSSVPAILIKILFFLIPAFSYNAIISLALIYIN